MFEIAPADMDSPRKLTQGVLQAAQLLGLYHAELARILRLNCADVGRLANAQDLLRMDSVHADRALCFLECYHCLYRNCGGDEAAMCHWLRREHSGLPASPLLMMVDHQDLQAVLDYLHDSVA